MSAQARWRAWSTDVHVVVADPACLPRAETLLRRRMAEVDLAASRFRPDSEIARLRPGTQRVGPLLATLVRTALDAAAATGGLVSPALGRHLRLGGYDRTYAALPADGPAAVALDAPEQEVRLDGDLLTLPEGVELDLGATAKAWVADDVACRLGTDAVVNVGGDLAVAGHATWPVAVGDPGDQNQVVEVRAALATSSTARRVWRRGGEAMHHVWDPRTGRPAATRWRTVSVAARTCVEANTASTAAVVLDGEAPGWLAARGLPARLVARDGTVEVVGGWPA